MRTKALLALSLSFLIAAAACDNASVRKTGPRYSSSRLQSFVEEYLKDKPNILGTIVKVDIQGAESYEAASGFIDSSRAHPIEPQTPFAIGSVTKIFTAVLVHQLIEKGAVQLQAPILEYLPPGWSEMLRKVDHADEITVEQVLSHRSGIPDVTSPEAFRRTLYVDRTAVWKPVDIVKMVQKKGSLEFRPGENFEYCNVNYILLGGLIEHVSGLSYREALQKNILDRIGLESTSLVGETYGSFHGALAHGYSRIQGALRDGHEVPVEWAHAAGGIVSTAGDLIKFYRALAAGDLFDDAGTYRKMGELVGYNDSYGRGLEVRNDPDIGLYYGHRGNFMKTRSLLSYFPADRTTLAIAETYLGFSMAHPVDLMKPVLQRIRGAAPPRNAAGKPEGPDLLAGASSLRANTDAPAQGEWDFAPKEQWRVTSLGPLPLGMVGRIHVDGDGSLYLLDRGSARIAVLDSGGNLLRSFGGHGDGPKFQQPVELFLTPRYLHVLDMGRSGDQIKTYTRSGHYVETSDLEKGVSPRLFLSDDRYVAVRSGPDVLNRPAYQTLEILSLKGRKGLVLGKFPSEEKLIMEAMVPRGRFILLEDDINIFPRLILHFDGRQLYLGRSDRYRIKEIDLSGGKRLAFSITGRERKMLPQDYAVNLADRTDVAGNKMTKEMKERFLAQFPGRQTLYTKISTDERGLLYVFVPDITDFKRQDIDIFSPEGEYLYRATVRLPGGLRRAAPLEFAGNHLYAMVKGAGRGTAFVKYGIRTPASSR